MSSVLTEEGTAVDEGRKAVALVIDADGHCSEPWQELGKWMPPEFANKGPTEYDGRIVWEDHVVLRATGRDPGPRGPYADTVNTAGRPGQEEPVQRLRDMDYEGIFSGRPEAHLGEQGFPQRGLRVSRSQPVGLDPY